MVAFLPFCAGMAFSISHKVTRVMSVWKEPFGPPEASLCAPHLQTLMTKAHREKLSSSKPDINRYASATMRIRLPEGLLLQGEFDAGWWACSLAGLLIHGNSKHGLPVKVQSSEAGCRPDRPFNIQNFMSLIGMVDMQYCMVA